MIEIWKNIKEYEGKYQVSNYGKVKNNKTGRILKPMLRSKNRYLCVQLSKNSAVKTYSIHRLVAEAFILNPNNYPVINHKDENKMNNIVSNLEWCSQKYNINYGSSLNKRVKSHKKPVIAFNNEHKLGIYFPSIKDAAAYFNGTKSNISKALKGCTKTAYGHTWEYV